MRGLGAVVVAAASATSAKKRASGIVLTISDVAAGGPAVADGAGVVVRS